MGNFILGLLTGIFIGTLILMFLLIILNAAKDD